jgi:hypothetical protein
VYTGFSPRLVLRILFAILVLPPIASKNSNLFHLTHLRNQFWEVLILAKMKLLKVYGKDFCLSIKAVFLFIYQKVYCIEWKLRICIYQNQVYYK